MKILKKYYFSLTILGILLLVSLAAVIKQRKKSQNIDANKYSTIALVDTAITRRTSSNIHYSFFFEGVKMKVSENNHKENIKATIGKFYRVQVSKENPNYTRILLNAEVTDSTLIREAGFAIDTKN